MTRLRLEGRRRAVCGGKDPVSVRGLETSELTGTHLCRCLESPPVPPRGAGLCTQQALGICRPSDMLVLMAAKQTQIHALLFSDAFPRQMTPCTFL